MAKRLFMVLWLLLLLLLPSFALAADFTMKAKELQALESGLSRLQQINQQQQESSIKLQDQLNQSLQKLTQAEMQSKQLQEQLNILSDQMQQQQKLLESANLSFKQYAQEEKAKISALKKQRIFLLSLLGVAIIKIAV